MSSDTNPANALTGLTLASGWKLTTKLTPGIGSTGGNFGVGYIGERGIERAFVKAIDFVGALNSIDPLAELAKLTSHANFERDALAYCGDRRMSKVVRLMGHEYVNPSASGDLMQRVFCLVMEIGDGDLRGKLHGTEPLLCSVILWILRDVALAIDQLHRGGVAHQDIKPSNVISMTPAVGVGAVDMKLGDLGRVVRKDVAGPFDSVPWPGDTQYMPPERWYGYRPTAWPDERESPDAFMLGSLMFFLFTGTPIQPLLVAKLPFAYLPGNWRGGFDEALVTVLRDAQARVITESLLPLLPAHISDGLVAIAKELTEPDPTSRGDRQARRTVGRPVGIDRFHQRLRELALRAEIRERVSPK